MWPRHPASRLAEGWNDCFPVGLRGDFIKWRRKKNKPTRAKGFMSGWENLSRTADHNSHYIKSVCSRSNTTALHSHIWGPFLYTERMYCDEPFKNDIYRNVISQTLINVWMLFMRSSVCVCICVSQMLQELFSEPKSHFLSVRLKYSWVIFQYMSIWYFITISGFYTCLNDCAILI